MKTISQVARDRELLQLAILNEKYYHGNWENYVKERKAVHLKYRNSK